MTGLFGIVFASEFVSEVVLILASAPHKPSRSLY